MPKCGIWCKAHHRYAHSARRDRGGRFFRSYSRNRGSGRIFFGRETTWRNESGSGGGDQRPV